MHMQQISHLYSVIRSQVQIAQRNRILATPGPTIANNLKPLITNGILISLSLNM